MKVLRPLLLAFAAIFFGLGISLPLLRLERLVFFSEEPSLIQIVSGLWAKGDIVVAGIVALFSIAFPAIKISLAAVAMEGARKVPHWASALSKWSLADVLLVAIVIFAAKTSGLANAFTQPGLWFYGASVVMLALSGIGRK